jgi:hypothetical protein
LIGFGAKALFKKADHFLGNGFQVIFLWPIALILAGTIDSYLER